jgi:hypothetical protein
MKARFYTKHVHLKFLGFKYEVLNYIEKWLRMNIDEIWNSGLERVVGRIAGDKTQQLSNTLLKLTNYSQFRQGQFIQIALNYFEHLLTLKEKKRWRKQFKILKSKLRERDYELTKCYIENQLEKEYKYFHDVKTTELAR